MRTEQTENRIYFDNAATTRAGAGVTALVEKLMREDYGNPSARHIMGVEAERYVTEAAGIIAGTLKCREKEIVFTSGGTESNNLALIGAAMANRRAGTHIITSAIEHPSVYEPLLLLESLGFRLTVLPVDPLGHVRTEDLREALCQDTVLVSVMAVNNETGALEPLEEIARTVKDFRKDIVFHVDAVQAYGKMKIYPKRLGIDLMSVSGHKLHGPKGVGFLFADEKVKLRPLMLGGGQQRGMRSGTVNTPGIAGLGLAAREAWSGLDETAAYVRGLKDAVIDGVGALEGVRVNTPKGSASAPHIVSISVRGVRAEVLLHALEEKGICVSSGSACSSHHPGISGTLKAIGLPEELLDCTIRVSLCRENTPEEVRRFLGALEELLPLLRRFARR